MAQTWKEKSVRFLRQARSFLFVVLVVLSFRSSIADWNDVPTGSMKPNILEGDRIFVNKLAYDLKVPFTTWHLLQWGDPQRGEVVVFYAPTDGTRMVKRVAAVPGDTVEMVNNRLMINGQPAQYGPPDPAIVAGFPAERRGPHRFETETVAGRSHPVMETPALPSRRTFGPVTVPPGKYMLLGDNRDNSFDSRYWGTVDRSQIVGRATGIALSFDPDRTLSPRWGRGVNGGP